MSYQLLALVLEDAAETIVQTNNSLNLLAVSNGTLATVWLPQAKKKTFESDQKYKIRALVSFQQALEKCQIAGTLLPGSFGCLLDDPEETKHTLTAFADDLTQKLETYGAKRQFQLSMKWPTQEVLAFEKQASSTNPQPTDKAAIAAEVERLIDNARHRAFDLLTKSLKDLPHETLSLPAEDLSIGMNVMTLIDGNQEPAFDNAIEAFDEALPYDPRISLQGPLPACSFASIDICPFNSSDAKAAADALGIDLPADRETVAKAFQKTAYASHPDQAQATENGEAEAVDLTALKIHRTFLYDLAQATAAGAGHYVRFVSDRDIVS